MVRALALALVASSLACTPPPARAPSAPRGPSGVSPPAAPASRSPCAHDATTHVLPRYPGDSGTMLAATSHGDRLAVLALDGRQVGGHVYDVTGDRWSAIASRGAPSYPGASYGVPVGVAGLVPFLPPWEPPSVLDLARNAWVSAELEAPAFGNRAARALVPIDGGLFYTHTDGSFDAASARRLDTATGRWRAIATVGAPSPRSRAAIVGLGAYVFVWGGRGTAGELGDGALYDVAADRWTPLPTRGAPIARSAVAAAAVKQGRAVVVFGGIAGTKLPLDGAVFDLASRAWTPLSASGPPPTSELAGRNRPEPFVLLGEHIVFLTRASPRWGSLARTWSDPTWRPLPGAPRAIDAEPVVLDDHRLAYAAAELDVLDLEPAQAAWCNVRGAQLPASRTPHPDRTVVHPMRNGLLVWGASELGACPPCPPNAPCAVCRPVATYSTAGVLIRW